MSKKARHDKKKVSDKKVDAAPNVFRTTGRIISQNSGLNVVQFDDYPYIKARTGVFRGEPIYQVGDAVSGMITEGAVICGMKDVTFVIEDVV